MVRDPRQPQVVPNVVISEILIATLESLDMAYPDAEEGLDEIVIV